MCNESDNRKRVSLMARVDSRGATHSQNKIKEKNVNKENFVVV